jgi:hypothetical protein
MRMHALVIRGDRLVGWLLGWPLLAGGHEVALVMA